MAELTLAAADIERLPNYKRKTAGEYSAACPFCGASAGGAKKDGFIFWPDRGNFFCRKCGAKGFVTDGDGSWNGGEREEFLAEVAKRAEEERNKKRAAVEVMASQEDRAAMYHHQMRDRAYWHDQGLSDATIDKHQLGYAERCPTYQQSPSWTIPVWFRGKLLSIRHRLIKPPRPGDKYRPEMAGLPAVIFNGDLFDQEQPLLVLVEGEIKAMALTQRGFPAIGIPGAATFKERWVPWFKKCLEVYVVFDPGAEAQAVRAAEMLGEQARLCRCPVKPDDFFVMYGGTSGQFNAVLGEGRRWA